jgi:hypothetical protein
MAIKAIASRATRPSTIIQIHMFELLLWVVCVVVVWLGREVCVVVVVELVEEALPPVCAGGALEFVFWANAGETAHARLMTSTNALKLLHN